MRRYIVGLVFITIVEIGLALWLTYWKESFWNYVAHKQGDEILIQLCIFTGVALCICFVSGMSGFLLNLVGIEWRQRLNSRALHLKPASIENLNQRIQQDCMELPDLSLNLMYGTSKSILYLLVFSVSLVSSFSWVFLLLLLGYSILGTWVTKRVAEPLIKLNYEQQRVEATYRNNICVENFTKCVHIMFGLARKQKCLTYLQQFYMQIGVVLPLILIAPLYLSTGMTLGMLMRFNSLGSTLLDNMSYGITNFAMINRLISCRRRLKEVGII